MVLKQAVEIIKEYKEDRLPLFIDVRVIYEAIDTVLAELKELQHRRDLAIGIGYDYDGYYNTYTKTGDVDGLVSVIDDMIDVLKYGVVETDITYCIRDCGNMECKRNKQHLPYENTYVSMSFFQECKEWKPSE